MLLYRIGRRWPLCLFHVFGGLVCIASPFIPPATGTSREFLTTAYSPVGCVHIQGRRHGFERGGQNFFDTPLFGQWGRGTKYGVDISVKA